MSEQVKVVTVEALDEAYRMGYNRFEYTDCPLSEFVLSHYTESATYIDNVAPKLRAMSGYSDSKVHPNQDSDSESGTSPRRSGTYQVVNKVAFVDSDVEDSPQDAELIDSQMLFDEMFDMFSAGAHDAVADCECDPTEHF